MAEHKWTDKDTSNHSHDSTSKVAKAEHDARDHATKSGLFERGNDEVNHRSFSRDDDSGKAAGGFWKSIFG